MTEKKMETCPVCNLSDQKIIKKVGIIGERIKCPRCKEFSILDSIEFTITDLRFGTKLSAWIRERNEQDAQAPQITTDLLENLHFDTNHYNHIVWNTAENLENQLYDFICAIIGKGKET